jgi:hypothetical protein
MKRQLFTRSLRINFSQISLFLFGHFFLFGPGATRTQYLAQMHYSFPPSLYHCVTGPHKTHTLSRHTTHTVALLTTHTVLAAASAPPFRLCSLVSLDHPHCFCLSKPQLCKVEAASKRLCGFQRCKGLPTGYSMNWIHSEQGTLLRMCHFDEVLDPFGIMCACLILSCRIRGTF